MDPSSSPIVSEEDKDDDNLNDPSSPSITTQNDNTDSMVDISLPDISWDLDRLNPPTEVPTSSPVAVIVNTPSPSVVTTPSPLVVTSEPQSTSSQPTNALTYLIPASTRTYSPTYSVGVRPTTFEPTSSSPITNIPSLLMSSTTDDDNDEATNTTTTSSRTYIFSCPPPSPTILTKQVTNGTAVSIEINPPISTVKISYDFQLELLTPQQQQQQQQEVEEIISKLEIQLETSLGTHLKDNTQYQEGDGEDDECDGYNVDEFRQRKRRNRRLANDDSRVYREREFGLLLQPKNMDAEKYLHLQKHRHVRAEDIVEAEQSTATKTEGEEENETLNETPTKIIAISSVKSLSIDDTRECTSQGENCYIVHGELDATYVGYNEVGVTSSISRVLKEQMMMKNDSDSSSSPASENDPPTYTIQYLAQDDTQEGGSRKTPNTPSTFATKLINGYKESLPELGDDIQLSPYGVGIMASLGMAFVMVCYVLFIKSDKKELKQSKKKALCEYDDSSSNGFQSESEQSYCYDLESVAIDYNDNDNENNVDSDDNGYREDGVEVRSLVGGRSSGGETKKMSNKAHDLNYNNVQNMPSLLESVDEEESSTTGGAGPSSISSSNIRGPKAVSPLDAGVSVRSNTPSPSNTPFAGLLFSRSGEQDGGSHTPLVDRIPSMELSPGGGAQIYQLPSISESTLPPPMNDTPHVVVTDRTTSKKKKDKTKKTSRIISEEVEEEQFEV